MIILLLIAHSLANLLQVMPKPVQIDTTVSEYTYTAIREAPLALKRLLPEKLFKTINTEKGAMRFATRSTLDQKRELFSYLGVECFLVFVESKKGEIDEPRKVVKDMDKDDKPSNTLAKLADGNAYVSGSKEFCFLLGLAAQVIDTKGYVRSSEMLRSGHHIKNFKNKIYVEEHKEANEYKEAAIDLTKYIQGTLWASDMCKEITGLEISALRVLIHFYLHRSAYISHETLVHNFAGGLSGRKLVAGRMILAKNLLIQRHPSQKRKEYTITGRGILVVNQFRDKVIKSFDF